MKYLYVLLIASVLFFVSANKSEARSGCCSHHGGVCGCGCCDGSSLSTTCAPYYPQCNAVPIPKVVKTPTPTPTPTYIPTSKPSVRPTAVPTSTPTVLGTNTSDSGLDNWTIAVVAGLVGAGVYHLVTKGKNSQS